MLKTIVLLLIFSFLASGAIAQDQLAPLKVLAPLPTLQINPGENKTIDFQLHLEKGFHAYYDKLKLSMDDSNNHFLIQLHSVDPIVDFFDKTDKKMKKGFRDQVTLKALVEAPLKMHDDNEIVLNLKYQACNDSFCTLPLHLKIPLKVHTSQPTSSPSLLKNIFSMNFESVLNHGLLITFIAVFFAGILTSFTPCIFPMIPITLAILGHGQEKRNQLQNFFLSCFYVLGIALTYSVLGLIAASTGSLFGSALQQPWFLFLISIIFFTMTLSMYGLFEMQAPAFVRNYFAHYQKNTGYMGAILTGVISGAIASPCVGPILVGILTYVAKTQNHWLGFFLLFTYAIGMGLLFIVLGFTHQLTRLLPRSGPWMNLVKVILGSLMFGVSIYYLKLSLPERWFRLALGIEIYTVAAFLGAFNHPGKFDWKFIRTLLTHIVVIAGGFFILLGIFPLSINSSSLSDSNHITPIHSLQTQAYTEAALEEARKNKKYVILDFYADWCAACLELEEKTFSHPSVKPILKDFVFLRIDNTEESPLSKSLIEKYKVVGLPTLIFIDSNGKVREDLTLTAFEGPTEFISRLKRLRPN